MEKEIVFNLIEHNSGTSEHIRRFYHHLYNIPNHEHAVRDLEKSLLEGIDIRPIYGQVPGASLTPESLKKLFFLIFQIYLEKMKFILPSNKELLVRFSCDGTHDVYKSSDNNNYEVLYFQFLNIEHPQNENSVFPLCILKNKENYQTLKLISEYVGLVDFISLVKENTLEIDKNLYSIDVLFSGDWITHCAEGNFSLPHLNTDNSSCGWCEFSKMEMKNNLESILKEENYGITSLPPSKKLYCWGHGMARLLTNCLSYIYSNFFRSNIKKSYFKKEIAERLNLTEWKKGISLDWNQAKKKLLNMDWNGIQKQFEDIHTLFIFKSRRISTMDFITILFEALTAYLGFAYIEHPSEDDFEILFSAKNALKWCFTSTNWNITPTTHFMLTHAIDLAIIYKTAFISLQEGVEKKNDFVKSAAHHTFKGNIKNNPNYNRYISILEHLLIQTLLDFGISHVSRLSFQHVHTCLSQFEFKLLSIFNRVNI